MRRESNFFIKTPRVNNQIRSDRVRVICEEGKNIGDLAIEEALRYARERNLDLIEVSDSANPPVCRVMDFGKYLYHQKKKQKDQKKKQKTGKLKSVRISLRISDHDIETKGEQIKKFLNKGSKVRVEVFLRGREKSKNLSDFAKEKLDHLLEKIDKEIQIKRESPLKRSPRGMEITIAKK